MSAKNKTNKQTNRTAGLPHVSATKQTSSSSIAPVSKQIAFQAERPREDERHRRTAEKTQVVTTIKKKKKEKKKKQRCLRAIKHPLVFGGHKVKLIQHGEAVFTRRCSGFGAAAPNAAPLSFFSLSLWLPQRRHWR